MSPGTGGQPGGRALRKYMHICIDGVGVGRITEDYIILLVYLPTSYIIILLVHSQRPKMNGKNRKSLPQPLMKKGCIS